MGRPSLAPTLPHSRLTAASLLPRSSTGSSRCPLADPFSKQTNHRVRPPPGHPDHPGHPDQSSTTIPTASPVRVSGNPANPSTPQPRSTFRRSKKAAALTTFEELTRSCSSLTAHLSTLTSLTPSWSSHAVTESAQTARGYKKDKAGNWRDGNAMLVLSKDDKEKQVRETNKEELRKLFTELSSTSVEFVSELTTYNNALKEESKSATNVIEEMYPAAAQSASPRSSTVDLSSTFKDFVSIPALAVQVKVAKKRESSTISSIGNRIQEYGLEEVSKVHRDDRFHLKKNKNTLSPTHKKTTYSHTMDADSTALFQKQVQLAMLRGQVSEKEELIASQGAKGTRNQEDLETLYVKAAEMKIKHLLEVIDRQQDSMSSNGMTFDKVSDATSSKETRLNETITRLQKQVEVMKKHQKEEDLQHAPTLPHSTNTIKEDESDEDSDNSASNDRSKEWKGALTHATPPPTASLQARNDELATSNAIMMEQLERVTNSGASKSKVDELAELLDDKEKAEKRRQVKKNRVTRLHATHADKTETVKNAKEMAMKAQKDRIEKEIEEYEGQVEQLTEDRLFAMFCKQTFVLAKNMKAAEHVDEGADADDDNEDVELVNEEEDQLKSRFNLLHTANAFLSCENIEGELKAVSSSMDVTKAEIEKSDADITNLVQKLTNLEHSEIVDEDGNAVEDVREQSDEDEKKDVKHRKANIVPRQKRGSAHFDMNSTNMGMKSAAEVIEDADRKKTLLDRQRTKMMAKQTRMSMTKQQQMIEIVKAKMQISNLTIKRSKAQKKYATLKTNSLTLASLNMEGKKMLHHQSVDRNDQDRFRRLAIVHQDISRHLTAAIQYLNRKSLLEKRLGYVKAKTKVLKTRLNNDPNAKTSNLAGMMDRITDEKSMKELASVLKQEVKQLNLELKHKNENFSHKRGVVEERRQLRALKNENSKLKAKLEKIEMSGGSAMEKFRDNRQIVSLHSSRHEANRKLKMLTNRIHRALGLHENLIREEAMKRKARGEGRTLSKKELEIANSIKSLKRQAVWWKKRLGEVLNDDELRLDQRKNSTMSGGASDFLSKMADRASKRSMRRSAVKKSKADIDKAMGAWKQEAEALDNVIVSEAADKWRQTTTEHNSSEMVSLMEQVVSETKKEEEAKLPTTERIIEVSKSGKKRFSTSESSWEVKEEERSVGTSPALASRSHSLLASPVAKHNPPAVAEEGGGNAFEKMNAILEKLRMDRQRVKDEEVQKSFGNVALEHYKRQASLRYGTVAKQKAKEEEEVVAVVKVAVEEEEVAAPVSVKPKEPPLASPLAVRRRVSVINAQQETSKRWENTVVKVDEDVPIEVIPPTPSSPPDDYVRRDSMDISRKLSSSLGGFLLQQSKTETDKFNDRQTNIQEKIFGGEQERRSPQAPPGGNKGKRGSFQARKVKSVGKSATDTATAKLKSALMDIQSGEASRSVGGMIVGGANKDGEIKKQLESDLQQQIHDQQVQQLEKKEKMMRLALVTGALATGESKLPLLGKLRAGIEDIREGVREERKMEQMFAHGSPKDKPSSSIAAMAAAFGNTLARGGGRGEGGVAPVGTQANPFASAGSPVAGGRSPGAGGRAPANPFANMNVGSPGRGGSARAYLGASNPFAK